MTAPATARPFPSPALARRWAPPKRVGSARAPPAHTRSGGGRAGGQRWMAPQARCGEGGCDVAARAAGAPAPGPHCRPRYRLGGTPTNGGGARGHANVGKIPSARTRVRSAVKEERAAFQLPGQTCSHLRVSLTSVWHGAQGLVEHFYQAVQCLAVLIKTDWHVGGACSPAIPGRGLIHQGWGCPERAARPTSALRHNPANGRCAA